MPFVYVAGPLFTQGERDLLEQIDQLCAKCSYQTYLPHRDAGVFVRGETPSSFFFNKDVVELEKADLVVAVLNGIEVDSGTAWEMGYAYARAKRLIGYVRDSRRYDPVQQFNPMVINSLSGLAQSLDELELLLRQT